MPIDQNLYFIAIIPPEPVYSEVKEFQHHIAKKYHSRGALKPPSHITLIPPFQQPPSKEIDLIKFIKNFAAARSKFELSVDGFGSFGVGVIYVAPENSEI